MRSGMIGLGTRASTEMNAAISSAASAPNSRTGADSQPCVVVWTIA